MKNDAGVEVSGFADWAPWSSISDDAGTEDRVSWPEIADDDGSWLDIGGGYGRSWNIWTFV